MKKLFYLLPLLLSGPLLAQTNYVANTANSATPGTHNTLVGPNAGNATMSGTQNTFVGLIAGAGNTTGNFNAFVGAGAGQNNTTGVYNTYLGAYAGSSGTTGNSNSFFGANAGQNNTTGSGNAFMGYRAGTSNTTGTNNAFIGTYAGQSNTEGGANTFIGNLAGTSNTTGNQNLFIGNNAGFSNSTGEFNSFMGSNAGSANLTGSNNAFVGSMAGGHNTTGGGNTFMGYSAGFANINGGANTFVGYNAGVSNVGGGANTFVGNSAGGETTTGAQNTYIGQDAGRIGNASGVNNVFIGYRAGVNLSSTVVSNAIAIGTYAIVSQSNSMVLGGTGYYAVKVGINNTAPQNRLEITHGTANQSGLRFTNLTSSSPATLLNQTKFLTVNASGDVVLASANSSARMSAESAGWLANGDNLQNTNSGGVVIGSGVGKTPAGYRLYVADGILTEKVKVAVKSTDDWSDHVFEKGYHLRSLGEVERYINQEKHLPGIPSAKEVVREGVDVGKMDARLLEKVEEMTLYLISIQKEVNALRQENQSLRQALKTASQQKSK